MNELEDRIIKLELQVRDLIDALVRQSDIIIMLQQKACQTEDKEAVCFPVH